VEHIVRLVNLLFMDYARDVNWDLTLEKEILKKQNVKLRFAALNNCKIVGDWYTKKGYKYQKYKKAIEYIRKNGYPDFIKLDDKWKGAFGKLN